MNVANINLHCPASIPKINRAYVAPKMRVQTAIVFVDSFVFSLYSQIPMLSVMMTYVLGTKHPVRFPVNLSSVRFVSRYIDMFVIELWRLAFKSVFRSDQPLVDRCHVGLAQPAQTHSSCSQLLLPLCMLADNNILE